MKRSLLLGVLCLTSCLLAAPSVLTPGMTIADFEAKRRPEILSFYRQNVYGVLPPEAETTSIELLSKKRDALGGIAIRREFRITLENKGKKFSFDALMYLPQKTVRKIPCIVALNFCGNRGTTPETDLATDEKATMVQTSRWDYPLLISSGFAVITASRNAIFPDRKDGRAESLWQLFSDDGSDRDHTAISAWARAYSVLRQIAASQKEIDGAAIWAHGHSRLGKTALWAAANDISFAGVVSNDSGCAGASLFAHKKGERIADIIRRFPYWFVATFDSFAWRDDELDFDQNFLLSLIAPRPLLVASAREDEWAGPENEFLAAKAIGEVYRLYGFAGIPDDAVFPADNKPLFYDRIGYYVREGKHDVMSEDWQNVIDFIRRQGKRN